MLLSQKNSNSMFEGYDQENGKVLQCMKVHIYLAQYFVYFYSSLYSFLGTGEIELERGCMSVAICICTTIGMHVFH